MAIQKQIELEQGMTAGVTSVQELSIQLDLNNAYLTLKYYYDAQSLNDKKPLKQKTKEMDLTVPLSSATIEAIKSDLDDYLLTLPELTGGTKI